MDILSRRLYNGGFNHLKRRTGSLILRVPRAILAEPLLVRIAPMSHQSTLVNVRLSLCISCSHDIPMIAPLHANNFHRA